MLHYSVERKNLMEKTSNKLVDLSVAFAVEILNLVKYLKEQRETIICNQIGAAGKMIFFSLCLFTVLYLGKRYCVIISCTTGA